MKCIASILMDNNTVNNRLSTTILYHLVPQILESALLAGCSFGKGLEGAGAQRETILFAYNPFEPRCGVTTQESSAAPRAHTSLKMD